MLRALATTTLVLLTASCASSGAARVAREPFPPEMCARFAQGWTHEGISMIESFDSLFDIAQRRSPGERPDPEDRMDRAPALLNGRSIANFVSSAYPRDLLFARRGGSTMMAVLVAADGTPARIRVFRSSGIRSLDEASIYVTEQFRFSPGIYRGCPAYTFVMMPVNWDPGPPPQGSR
jgi:TonB family protein